LTAKFPKFPKYSGNGLSETISVLIVAAALSVAALSMLAWRVARYDPAVPDRLIGELRLARWAAILLAGVGGVSVGLAAARPDIPFGNADAALGFVFVGLGGIVLQRDPREGLLLAAGSFVLHALLNIAHRPGWLSVEVAPHWFTVGSAVYDVYVAALCYWARRR
jgi:hypothetical protein